MNMTRRKRISLTISVATLLLIYVSFWFISYSDFQGYVIAGIIFCLSVGNCFVIGQTDRDYPALNISIGKRKLKVLNYRLLFIGLLCGMMGLVYLRLDVHSPFAHVVLSTGLFAAAFTRIIWPKTMKQRPT